MNDNKKEKEHEQTPENKEGADVQAGSWKRLFSKKWAFPAMYMAVVVLIVSFMVYFQGNEQTSLTDSDLGLGLTENTDVLNGEDLQTDLDIPVIVSAESINWPVENRDDLEIIRHFYDENGDNESKLDSVVEFDGSVTPSVGISLSQPDGETFDVLAALSGKVTRIEKIPYVGNIVEIMHEDGLKTVYQSLSDVQVEIDQEVEQGNKIAEAGTNELDKEVGVHLDFEIYQNEEAVNPEQFIQS